MKTTIRSSTFWWTLAFLFVVIAPTRAVATGAATPAPTPAGESYLITWNATAKGRSGRDDRSGMTEAVQHPVSCEFNQSSATQGSAIVRFKYEGNPPELKRDSRIIAGNMTDERDEKVRVHSPDCGDFVEDHDHYSYVPIEPIIGMDWWMASGGPRQEADGSWKIKYPFNGRAAFDGPHQAHYIHESETKKCDSPCIKETLPGCVAWGPGKLYSPSTKSEPTNGLPPMLADNAFPPDQFDLTAPDPNFFSKQFEADFFGGCSSAKIVKVKWEVTVRRIGKCLVGDSIPINDQPINPDINDEDIEMGVENGGDSIDPDSGVAALNLRVTCDQVPIKNAKVNVRVFASAGGHLHFAVNRPRGSLKWNGVEKKLTDQKPSIEVKTDDDGRAHLTFKPGKAAKRDNVGIAGIYEITATPVRFPQRTAKVAVEAKVDNLAKLDPDPNYVDDCRGDSHTSGDNATAATRQSLIKFGSAFHDAQVDHNNELVQCQAAQWQTIYPLWVIDVSLPTGGLYDLDDDFATPHQTHGRGDGVDFSVKPRADSSSSAPKWPKGGIKMSDRVPVCGGSTDPQGWLTMTMMRLGTNYGHWDAYDLCQHPNVCAGWSNNQPWVECCPDNITCPKWEGGPAMMGPPCPGLPYPAGQCLHCPTDQLWHLHVNQ